MLTSIKEEVREAFLNGATIIIDDTKSVIDDHIDCYLVELVNENKELSLLTGARAECLNSLYYESKSETLHLSSTSIGGTVYSLDFEKYNNSVIYETSKIKRVIDRQGKIIFELKEEEKKMSNLDNLKQELEDLLAPEKDPRILDLLKLVCNIRSDVIENSRTHKICDKLARMCREDELSFDNDILPLLSRAVTTMNQDLMDNDILKNAHNPNVAHNLNRIEVKFL